MQGDACAYLYVSVVWMCMYGVYYLHIYVFKLRLPFKLQFQKRGRSPARSPRQVPLLRGDMLAVLAVCVCFSLFMYYLQSHYRLRNVTLVGVLCAYNKDPTMALV